MLRLIDFLSYVIVLYEYVIIASVILSWLLNFGVVNYSNGFVKALWQGFSAVTEPLLRPIRRMLPSMGGLDLSPIILLLGCLFVRYVVLGNIRDAIAR
jgi:YggT family protein